jgi:UPF0042 nucleotide-binding protein
MTTTPPPRPVVLVTSFGYLHGDPPLADVTLDLRGHLLDPHVSPALRELTGRDLPVVANVMRQPGAASLVTRLAMLAVTLYNGTPGAVVQVAIGCAGGRHRSVVIADRLATELEAYGRSVDVSHRDVDRPVVTR